MGNFVSFCIFKFQNFPTTEAFDLLEYYVEYVVYEYECILGRFDP